MLYNMYVVPVRSDADARGIFIEKTVPERGVLPTVFSILVIAPIAGTTRTPLLGL
jgi:hypothetical protein